MRFLGFAISCFALPVMAGEIWLGATTTLRDSGFLDYILAPFEEATGHEVIVLAQPTGQILQSARDGNVDLLLTHEREFEEAFITEGYGRERRELMASHFVLVGPQSDPAGVAALDIDKAFRKIALEKPAFVARDDESGTSLREEKIWARNAVDDLDFRILTGQGMGASLNIASALDAYIFADDASFYQFLNKGALAILVTEGKDLENIYAITSLDETRFADRNLERAEALVAYLFSEAARARIVEFRIDKKAPFAPKY